MHLNVYLIINKVAESGKQNTIDDVLTNRVNRTHTLLQRAQLFMLAHN
jgi:hypothetical protein